jgi:uncharacterized protein YaaQ
MIQMLTDYWEVAVSLIAVVLAVMAFAVSLWSFWETRKHNRSSVMPYLQFAQVNAPREGFPYDAGIWLTNYGAGLARMEKLIVHFDDQPAVSLLQALHAIGLLPSDDFKVGHLTALGKFLGPGETRCILGIDTEHFGKQHQAIVTKAFARLTLRLAYRSMYDESGEVRF